MKFGKLYRKSPTANMIPIINVIFLLLIFFLMQGSYNHADPTAIKVPNSTSGKVLNADATEVFLSSKGVFIGSETIEDASVFAALEKLAAENPNRQILLKADADVDSTRLVEILKLAKQAGISNLYMVTKSSQKQLVRR